MIFESSEFEGKQANLTVAEIVTLYFNLIIAISLTSVIGSNLELYAIEDTRWKSDEEITAFGSGFPVTTTNLFIETSFMQLAAVITIFS